MRFGDVIGGDVRSGDVIGGDMISGDVIGGDVRSADVIGGKMRSGETSSMEVGHSAAVMVVEGVSGSRLAVVLTDDHPIVRAGLRAVIDAEPDMSVVAEFATAEDLLAAVRGGLHADVICLDLRFGSDRMTGSRAAAELSALAGPPVLILTTYDSDAEILSAVEAGATGYLLKDAPTDELTAAIRAAAAGQVALGPQVQRKLLGRLRAPSVSLTRRELEVLSLVAAGRSNDEVAADLFLSRATVKTHLVHIFDKLAVQSRTAAVARAREQGVLAER